MVHDADETRTVVELTEDVCCQAVEGTLVLREVLLETGCLIDTLCHTYTKLPLLRSKLTT
jgi:hypothetical protein